MTEKNTGISSNSIPWIDEFALAEHNRSIYHYTNFINLRSILGSNGLRATPFSETNDRNEFYKAADILCPKIYEHAKKRLPSTHPEFVRQVGSLGLDLDEELQKDSRTFYKAGLSTNIYRPHLVCFSYHSTPHHQNNGNLTLWRSYGGIDGGIAIGFDTQRLIHKTITLQQTFGFLAIYLDYAYYGDHDPRLKERLNDSGDLFEAYFRFVDAQLKDGEPSLDSQTLHKLLVLMGCVKHEDFSDEREIRMIVGVPDRSKEFERKIEMHGSRMLIEIGDCINEILIGPSRDQFAIEAAVKHTLRAHNRENVVVRKSGTPFRSA